MDDVKAQMQSPVAKVGAVSSAPSPPPGCAVLVAPSYFASSDDARDSTIAVELAGDGGRCAQTFALIEERRSCNTPCTAVNASCVTAASVTRPCTVAIRATISPASDKTGLRTLTPPSKEAMQESMAARSAFAPAASAAAITECYSVGRSSDATARVSTAASCASRAGTAPYAALASMANDGSEDERASTAVNSAADASVHSNIAACAALDTAARSGTAFACASAAARRTCNANFASCAAISSMARGGAGTDDAA